MLASIQLERSELIQQLQNDYLHTLTAPMDGMWESAIIPSATFWEIRDQDQHAGHFCLDSNNNLLRFHLLKNYQARAQEIFHQIISTYNIQYAITSTIEPLYLSLCLDLQRSITLHSYLFHDNQHSDLPSSLNTGLFKKAEKSELATLMRFYHTNTEGPGAWIEPFLNNRLNREELFTLYNGQTLLATGECISSKKQPPYADLGMVVAQSYRGKGLGTSMLIQLKQYCYENGWKPICSCDADNHASKKAIEKAGFISDQRRVRVQF